MKFVLQEALLFCSLFKLETFKCFLLSCPVNWKSETLFLFLLMCVLLLAFFICIIDNIK